MTQLVWSPWFNNFWKFLDDFSNVFNVEKLWGVLKNLQKLKNIGLGGC